MSGHLGKVKVLNFLYTLDPKLLFETDAHGWSAATRAIHNNQLESLKILHTLNPDYLDTPDNNGKTTRFFAKKLVSDYNETLTVLRQIFSDEFSDSNPNPFYIFLLGWGLALISIGMTRWAYGPLHDPNLEPINAYPVNVNAELQECAVAAHVEVGVIELVNQAPPII